MPYLEWHDSLSVGIRSIDAQHRKLANMVNQLHDAAGQSGPQCTAQELVARLKDYAAEHFHIEEGYMQAFGYPGLESHQKEHEAFCTAVQGFENACAEGGAIPAEVVDFLKNWLTRHIIDVDMQMGRFLKDYLK